MANTFLSIVHLLAASATLLFIIVTAKIAGFAVRIARFVWARLRPSVPPVWLTRIETAYGYTAAVGGTHPVLIGADSGVDHLITIPFSHFVEKVRWAMDYHNRWAGGGSDAAAASLAVPYIETAAAPAFHIWYTALTSGSAYQQVPMLVPAPAKTSGSRHKLVTDSTDILKFLSTERGAAWLYPSTGEVSKAGAEALRLEEYFDDKLGPAARRVAYYHFLSQPELYPIVLKMVSQNSTSALERAAAPFFFPGVKLLIEQGLGINAGGFARSSKVLTEVFDYVSQLLADGREYLASTKEPSAADITFAALSYPVIAPPEMNRYLHPFDLESRGQPFFDLTNQLRATKAGQFDWSLNDTTPA